MLFDEARAVVAAPAVIFGHAPILCGETTVFTLDG